MILSRNDYISLAGRMMILCFMLLAFFEFSIDWGPRPPNVSLFIDRSASMGDAPTSSDIEQIVQALDTLPSGSRVRQVHFASGVPILKDGTPTDASVRDAELANDFDSDLAGALGLTIWPQSEEPELRVLISDGRISSGYGRDIDVWLPTLPVERPGEVGIGRLSVDMSEQDNWIARGPITRSKDKPVTIDVLVNGRRTSVETISAGGARSAFHDLPLGSLPPGRHLIEAVLQNSPHGERQNDRSGHIIELSGPGRALLVTDASTSPVETLMQSIGWSVEMMPAEILPDQRQEYAPYHLVVFEDIAASRLQQASIDALATAVRNDGVGLGVLGGPRSFSAGGYLGSAFEELLPVISEDAIRDKPQRVVFLVDASGSMSKTAQGGTRFSYAIQAVELGLESLGDTDESALVFFDSEASVYAPLQTAPESYLDESGEIGWSPSGGTDIEAALTKALALFPVDTQADHTIVLITDGADGTDAPLDNSRVETLQAQAGVTLLAILIAPSEELTSGHTDNLRSLSQGQLTVVQRVDSLPRLLRAEMDAQTSPIQSGPHAISAISPLPGQDATLEWLPIVAYPVARTRSGASLHLQSQRGSPILATSSLELGRVFSILPGLGSWTKSWLEDPALVNSIADLLVWSSGQSKAQELSLQVSHKNNVLTVRAELITDSGEWRTDRPMQITIRFPSGDFVSPPMTQIAPGLFEAFAPSVQQGVHEVTVKSGSSVSRQAVWIANSEARQALDPRTINLEGVRAWSLQTGLLPANWPRRILPLGPILLSLALFMFVMLLTYELRPAVFSQPTRWGRKAKLAIFPNIRKNQRGLRG